MRPEGYGGAANDIAKKPERDTFPRGAATIGGFGVYHKTIDVDRPLNDDKSLLFRLTGAARHVGNFVDFVSSRSVDIAPALLWTFDNGDLLSFRGNYDAETYVDKYGLPASPVFLHLKREFNPGDPANLRGNFRQYVLKLKYEHAFDDN